MLSRLSVRDFAVVETAEIEFGPGMTVLTGETGAGKSVLVDALSLAVGERASAELVRGGAERADISAVFEVSGCEAAISWLEEQQLNERESECILRRTVALDGRSRAYVNGRPVPVQTLRGLGNLLVDIHGQHEHQSVLRAATQRELLDEFADHRDLLREVASLAATWRELDSELTELIGAGGDQEARIELLRYQHEELTAFAPVPGEIAQMEQALKRLTNITTMLETCNRLLEQLTGRDGASVLSVVQAGARQLHELPDNDPKLTMAVEMLESASIQVQEAINDLRSYADSLEPDPDRVSEIELRLTTAHDIARKHRISADELPELVDRLSAEIGTLEHGAARAGALTAGMNEVHAHYLEAAKKLHQSRNDAALRLANSVSKQLAVLGMAGSTICIEVSEEPSSTPRAHGLDRVELKVATNPGQPVLPLARVASGGELSRVSLGLQVVTTKGTGIPTVIFDEVDVGIGGRVAEAVGQHLHALGTRRQVLCVTHLPQVASQADAHVQVTKKTGRNRVQTRFETLAEDGRVEEIARMLGGLEITAQTRAHAREMLTRDKKIAQV